MMLESVIVGTVRISSLTFQESRLWLMHNHLKSELISTLLDRRSLLSTSSEVFAWILITDLIKYSMTYAGRPGPVILLSIRRKSSLVLRVHCMPSDQNSSLTKQFEWVIEYEFVIKLLKELYLKKIYFITLNDSFCVVTPFHRFIGRSKVFV